MQPAIPNEFRRPRPAPPHLLARVLVALTILAPAATSWAAPAQPLPLAGGNKAALPGAFRLAGRALDPAWLPRGPVEIGGVTLTADPAAAICVTGSNRQPVILVKPAGEVKASHLAFLHTFQPGRALEDWRAAVGLAHRKVELPPAAPEVLRYEVVYADGETLPIPVRFGEAIEQWYRAQAVAPMLWAREAWVRPIDPRAGDSAVAYLLRWPNPRPEKPVAEIRVAAGGDRPAGYGDALVLAVAAVQEPPPGNVYYIDRPPIGSDAAAGSFDAPWASLGHAVKQVGPGDTVYLRGGYYVLDRPVVIEKTGAPDKWLTISAYPGETPVLDGFGVLNDYRLQPYNEKGPRPSPFQHDSGLIHAPGSPQYLRIQGLHLQRSRRAAISAYGKANEDRGAFVEIAFNTVDRAFSMGTITHGIDDLRIIGNRFCRPHSAQMLFDEQTLAPMALGEHPQESIDLSRNDRFEVAFNEVYGSNKEAVDAISVKDGRIHHNYIHSSLSGIYIDSWTIPIERVEVDHNFIHNAFNGIPCSTEGSNQLVDFRIHHNIVIDSKAGAIGISEATYKAKPTAVRGHRIFANTIHRDGYHATGIGWFSSGLRVAGFAENTEFRDVAVFDNIVTAAAQAPMTCSFEDPAARQIIFSHNLTFPADDRTPQWIRERDPKAAAGYRFVAGDQTVTKDPLYADPDRGDFRLRQGSPAIGAGAAPAADGRFDPRGARCDLGALPAGAAWSPGCDWAGRPTAFYYGTLRYRPVDIPDDRFTLHRNHLQRPSWYQIGRYGVDFQHLPDGEQSFAGITWLIEPDRDNSGPTVLALRGVGTEVAAERIAGIPVGRPADTLCFLQTYHPGPALNELAKQKQDAGVLLFHFVVHYADGSTADIPVRWQQEIERWQAGDLRDLPAARLAWTIPFASRKGNRSALRLYAFEWTNPKPQLPVATVDLVADASPQHGSPAVFAISTGHR